jgi:hypothetical protein
MILKINQGELTKKILLILCGFIVFSPLSSVITMDIMRLPLALPELLLIPFLVIWHKKILRLTFNRSIIWLFVFFVILLVISLLLHNFRPSSILSTSRGYLYMLLSFAVFKGENKISVYDIMLVSFGSVLGWCFISIGRFIEISHGIHMEGSFTSYGNLVTLALLVIISIVTNNRKFTLWAIITGLILTFTTGLRRQIVIFVISLFLSLLFRFKDRIAKSIKTLIVVAILLLAFIAGYKPITGFVKEKAPVIYFRVVVRTEQFITGKYAVSDQYRKKTFDNYLKNISEYYFPRGFVSKRTMQDKTAGLYMDFPIIELSYMLGIFILALFLISFFYYLVKHFIYFMRDDNKESLIWAISGTVLLALFFLEGTNLNYAYITPFTGMVLGKVYTLKKVVKTIPSTT